MNQTKPYIVCAAIRKDGIQIAGARHLDAGMRALIKELGQSFGGWEQGFIDQFNNFITREEAWKIADSNGQIRRVTGWEPTACPRPANVGDEGMLFSENLY